MQKDSISIFGFLLSDIFSIVLSYHGFNVSNVQNIVSVPFLNLSLEHLEKIEEDDVKP